MSLLSAMQPLTSDDIDLYFIRNLTHTFSNAGRGDANLEKLATLFMLHVTRYLRGRRHPETSKGKTVEIDASDVAFKRRLLRAELLLRAASGSSSIPLVAERSVRTQYGCRQHTKE